MASVVQHLFGLLQGGPIAGKPPIIAPPQVPAEATLAPQYRAVPLLTPTEAVFFQQLDEALPAKYTVWAKVRVADLVVPDTKYHSKEWFSAFGKIKAKHIDFVIVRGADCAVVRLVELDDTSHMRKDRVRRDRFVDQVVEGAGLKMIRVQVDEESRARFIKGLRAPSK